MATTPQQPVHQKFFELIRPDHNFDFIGLQRYFIGTSVLLFAITLVMLPINYFRHGSVLNYSIEFRGGTEVHVHFAGPQEAGKIREALSAGGLGEAEVVVEGKAEDNTYILRFGAVSTLDNEQKGKLEDALKAKVGTIEGEAGTESRSGLRKFELSEGGDKVYLRFAKDISTEDIQSVLKAQGVSYAEVKTFGRAEDNTFEVVLVSVTEKVKTSLEQSLGVGAVADIPSADSVGAKAGKELRDDGIKSLLFAILIILLYVAVRFDFRYGPGTVVALLHDAVLVVGAFALFYKEFSLTTVAAILTVIGFSMNDTIVVFDRIRENAAKLRNVRFDRIVNQSINETLSRTILTSGTVFLVTLAMNILGSGVIRDFAFAMNVGVIVGTYSSIFIASPILIWLNERFYKPAPTKPARSAG